ncbi:MAG: TraB/GumN family protein [Flavobacteriales bacterium]|nr:TraB/GumN family protein [Flavobacteriales bacterium]
MRFPLLLTLLAPFLLGAQPLEQTLLWRIGSQKGGASSYLYGTMHTKDERAFQFGDSVLPALDRSTVVAGELDLAIGDQGIGLLKRMWMPNGKQLKDLYRKKDWIRVEKALNERLGMAAPMLYRVKPMFVEAMLSESTMGGARSQVLDEYLQVRARDLGKRVIGVETIDEQLGAMDALTVKEQAKMLLDHVDHDGYPKELDAMLDAYAAQDLEGLLGAAEKSGSMPKAMEQALITERNTRMVHRMDSLLQGGEGMFFPDRCRPPPRHHWAYPGYACEGIPSSAGDQWETGG